MEYILENPLNGKCTIFSQADTNEYGESTYTAQTVNCAIFEGLQKVITADGREVVSNTTVGIKNNVSLNAMLYLGETVDLTPPFGSYEIKKVAAARDVDQVIEGYWIWL